MTVCERDELVELVRKAVTSSVPFVSCWEFSTYEHQVDPEQLHKRLRELVGLSETEQASATK